MKSILEQLQKEARRIVLRRSEKEGIRSALLQRMNETPIISPIQTTAVSYSFNWLSVKTVSFAFSAVVLIVSGSVSVAAERSVPGERLYSVKTNVNESVKSFLAITPTAGAKIQAELIEVRLKEAEKLALRGTLTADSTLIIENKIGEHIEAFKNEVRVIEETRQPKVALEEASRLESSLKAHTSVFEKLSESTPDTASIAGRVKSEAARVTTFREDVETKVVNSGESITPSGSNDLDMKRRQVSRSINDAKNKVSAIEQAPKEAKAAIEGAQEAFAEAIRRLEEGRLNDAFILLQRAQRAAKEAEMIADAVARLAQSGKDIRETKPQACTETSECAAGFVCLTPGSDVLPSTGTTSATGLQQGTSTTTPGTSGICVEAKIGPEQDPATSTSSVPKPNASSTSTPENQ